MIQRFRFENERRPSGLLFYAVRDMAVFVIKGSG